MQPFQLSDIQQNPSRPAKFFSKSVATSEERSVVEIKDPVSQRVIVSIKNPKIPIKPLDENYEGINLEKIL